ncbi:MAG: helix-hairpin-helix domain-containing protein [Holophagaceae bacterium]|nr:helix-hairpin-helix domain-containing protein [Holophagaceae bacterium]
MNLKLSLSIALILLSPNFGLAAQTKPTTNAKPPAATDKSTKSTVNPLIAAQSKARSMALKAGKAKAPKVNPVDINNASKDELKTIPGVTDAYADKIIAGRPYLTKAHLVTHNIISAGLYDSIKKRIYAKQNLQKR